MIRTIKRSSRSEFEITSVNNVYISRKRLFYDVYEGRWTDAGTLQSFSWRIR